MAKKRRSRRNVEYIDLTPTWMGLFPAMLAVLADGTAKGKRLIKADVMRAARHLDKVRPGKDWTGKMALVLPLLSGMKPNAANYGQLRDSLAIMLRQVDALNPVRK